MTHPEIKKGTDTTSVRPLFSVIVTNWNGEEWLTRCMSSIQLSARKTGLAYEVIMVDDASDDDSVKLVRSKFTDIKILECVKNVGYAEATNRGVRAAKGRYVVLCNNDLAPKEEFLPGLLKWFVNPELKSKHRELFGVSARTLSWWDGSPNQLCMGARMIGGRLSQVWLDPDQPTECIFVQAGAAAYDRKKYLKLGGLNPVFHPGYWEDYDLSWRAAKSGWKCLYDPDAVALHHGGGSMVKRFGQRNVDAMKARNHLMFEWMNLSDSTLLLNHIARISVSVMKEWIRGNELPLTQALQSARTRFSSVIQNRLNRPEKMNDQAILKRSRKFKRS